jgi:hypothetical protein
MGDPSLFGFGSSSSASLSSFGTGSFGTEKSDAGQEDSDIATLFFNEKKRDLAESSFGFRPSHPFGRDSLADIKIVHSPQCFALHNELCKLPNIERVLRETKKDELNLRRMVHVENKMEFYVVWSCSVEKIAVTTRAIESATAPLVENIKRLMTAVGVCDYCRKRAATRLGEQEH